MSVSIYDTAWASMVFKAHDAEAGWLFPESFLFILDHQLTDGSWPSESCDLDGILNTLAGLLALLIHREKGAGTNSDVPQDLLSRISKATVWLERKLEHWDPSACDSVGFEVLIPSLTRLLQNHGIVFPFPRLKALAMMGEKKMSKLKMSAIYSGQQATILHSVEALVGRIDFDKLAHLKVGGSMMGSPSATSAYLMYSSAWDEEAESYLRDVFQRGQGHGSGGFPSAFPSEVFEITWTLSTLLEFGFTPQELSESSVGILGDYLEELLNKSGGTVGYAAGMMHDADDTAKALQSLYLLGRTNIGTGRLISEFSNGACFKTYEAERNPSPSANCNVLKALLLAPRVSDHAASILKATQFLCDVWFSGSLHDKWNQSPEYSMMLLCQSMMKLIQQWHAGELNSLPYSLIQDKILIILVQILSRTLLGQEDQGSWANGSHEVTAYAVLTLIELSSLPYSLRLKDAISIAISKGQQFLSKHLGHWTPSSIWIEKVTYSSPLLTSAYCLAALHATARFDSASIMSDRSSEAKLQKFQHFFSRLPLFAPVDKRDVKMQVAMHEGSVFFPYLKRIEFDIFPPTGAEDSKYLEYIPFTWTTCNVLSDPVPTQVLLDMMVISMLNFQADAYIEKVVGKKFGKNLEIVRKVIDNVCTPSEYQNASITNINGFHEEDLPTEGTTAMMNVSHEDHAPDLREIKEVLSRYANFVLGHPSVRRSKPGMQSRVRKELAIYLHAQVTSIDDNLRLAKSRTDPDFQSVSSLYEWVRTTGADHTSCPYSFAFFQCLITPAGKDCCSTVPQSYLMQDLGRQLATSCRMLNDYGSIARDQADCNFNCIDCREF
ncbi:hypothetical protein K432DRAFT_264366, partial [Lepidopterella palustris CBS 459.81]